ncbi:hypothetical protein CC86DRAFT_386610 [Ophiobolus disseminans]|uniref:Uncharacterized protein n=1 Tax=Ophiobolus disseminans TaxID=1469910 RepID=A0A6A6ZIX9_9PLEO|nr:hypothetical protein CC86DRAFT_386610 [Ophiobolus disseminans]
MVRSIQDPIDNSVLRNRLPAAFYVVHNNTEEEADIRTSVPFSWNSFTRENIEAHLASRYGSIPSTPFISAYSDFSTTCSAYLQSGVPNLSATILTINTHDLVPAWAVMSNQQIPIWIEQAPLPRVLMDVFAVSHTGYETFQSSAWICVEEIKSAFGLEGDGIEGVWLACGKVMGRMVLAKERVIMLEKISVPKTSKNSERVHGTSRLTGVVPREVCDQETQTEPEETSSSRHILTEHATQTEQIFEPAGQTIPGPQVDLVPYRPTSVILPPDHPHLPSIAEVLSSTHLRSQGLSLHDASKRSQLTSKVTTTSPARTAKSLPPPTPQLQLELPPPPAACLLHPAISSTSPLSLRSAETLAKLEDVRLNGEALKMWITEVIEREKRKKRGKRKSSDTGGGKVEKKDIWNRED